MSKFAFGKYRSIIISVALFLLLDASVLVFNFYVSFQISEDAVGVNLAGRQRMLSQRMAKSLYILDSSRDDPLFFERTLRELELSQELFDQTLKAFTYGGQVKGAGDSLVILKPVKSQKAIANLQAASAFGSLTLLRLANLLVWPVPVRNIGANYQKFCLWHATAI